MGCAAQQETANKRIRCVESDTTGAIKVKGSGEWRDPTRVFGASDVMRIEEFSMCFCLIDGEKATRFDWLAEHQSQWTKVGRTRRAVKGFLLAAVSIQSQVSSRIFYGVLV